MSESHSETPVLEYPFSTPFPVQNGTQGYYVLTKALYALTGAPAVPPRYGMGFMATCVPLRTFVCALAS